MGRLLWLDWSEFGEWNGLISQLRYRATGASSSTTSASGTVQEAQDRFDSAKEADVEADSWWEKIYHSDAWQVVVPIDAHRLRREPNVFVPKVKELMPSPGRPRR